MRALHPMIRWFRAGSLALAMIALTGCGGGEPTASNAGSGDGAKDGPKKQPMAGAEPADAKPSAPVEEVDTERARALVQQKEDLLVLDIRTPEEFEEGHIAGARNVDFYGEGFEKKLRAMKKGQPVLLHCASGGRSAKARDLMRSMDFEKVYHFGGGMNAWKEAGYPVKKPGEREGSQSG